MATVTRNIFSVTSVAILFFILGAGNAGWSLGTLLSNEKIATNNASIIINHFGVELDILHSLNLSHHMRGVSRVPSPINGTLAWRLHTAFDQVQVPSAIVTDVLSLWPHHRSAISFYFVVRQHKKTIATLVSVNSPGKMSPFLRLTSNSKNGQQLVLFYHTTDDSKLHQTAFVLPRTQNWTRIAMAVNGEIATLRVDCERAQKWSLVGPIDLKFPKDSLIYFRQEPGNKKKLLGAVQTAKLFSYEIDRPWNCTGLRHDEA